MYVQDSQWSLTPRVEAEARQIGSIVSGLPWTQALRARAHRFNVVNFAPAVEHPQPRAAPALHCGIG